jgi:hypothetical protein
MKKYVVGLFLLFAQNVGAMELSPVFIPLEEMRKKDKKCKLVANITSEDDEKCKLVAKYLYRYPTGTNKKESHKINRFLNDTRNHHHTAVLRQYVKKYIKMLHNIEAEEILCTLHTMNFPPELKQIVFMESLRDKAQKDYAINHAMHIFNNTLVKVCTVYKEHVRDCPKLLKQYFLSEINEKNNIIMMFVHSSGNSYSPNFYFLSFCYLNCNISDAKEFHELRDFYHTNFYSSPSNNGRGFHHHPTFQDHSWIQCFCEEVAVAKLNDYLDARWDRVNASKNKFAEQIDLLVKNNKEELVTAYIDLLKSLKVH